MSIAKKLKLSEAPLYLLNATEGYAHLFEMVDVKTALPKAGNMQQVFLFAIDRKQLDATVKKVMLKLADDGVLWVAYPKKSGSIKSDLSRDSFWDALSAYNYAPVMQVAIDADWSALRFRKTEDIGEMLRDVPMEERTVEGIDFKNRTVQLPKDAVAAINAHKGLEAFFYTMSFSHKKEYVQSIVEAKKPETRVRRIEKMIEMVAALKSKKENK